MRQKKWYKKKKPRIASRLLYGGYTDADVSSSSIRLLSLFLKIWIFWCCFLICALSSLSRGVSNTPRIKKSRVVFSEMATSTNKSMEAVPSPRSIFPKWRSLIFSFTANCSCVKPLVFAQLLDAFSCDVRIKVHKPALRPQNNAVASCATRSECRDAVGGEPSSGCRGSVGTQSISFSCFFVLSLSMMARRAEHGKCTMHSP